MEWSSTVVHSNEIMFYLAYQIDGLNIDTIIAWFIRAALCFDIINFAKTFRVADKSSLFHVVVYFKFTKFFWN